MCARKLLKTFRAGFGRLDLMLPFRELPTSHLLTVFTVFKMFSSYFRVYYYYYYHYHYHYHYRTTSTSTCTVDFCIWRMVIKWYSAKSAQSGKTKTKTTVPRTILTILYSLFYFIWLLSPFPPSVFFISLCLFRCPCSVFMPGLYSAAHRPASLA